MATVPAEPNTHGGRLPLVDGPDLPRRPGELFDQLHALAVPFAERVGFAPTTADGKLIGLWNLQLDRSVPAAGFNQWVQTDQRCSSLPPRIREIVMLAVGVALDAPWVRYSHIAAARTTGLPDSMIASLLHGRTDDDAFRLPAPLVEPPVGDAPAPERPS